MVHTLELCTALGRSATGFLPFPALAGEAVAKHAWAETLGAGVVGLGVAVTDPDGRPALAVTH